MPLPNRVQDPDHPGELSRSTACSSFHGDVQVIDAPVIFHQFFAGHDIGRVIAVHGNPVHLSGCHSCGVQHESDGLNRHAGPVFYPAQALLLDGSHNVALLIETRRRVMPVINAQDFHENLAPSPSPASSRYMLSNSSALLDDDCRGTWSDTGTFLLNTPPILSTNSLIWPLLNRTTPSGR